MADEKTSIVLSELEEKYLLEDNDCFLVENATETYHIKYSRIKKMLDENFITSQELEDAIADIEVGGGGSDYDDTELRNEIADIWDVINYKAPSITSFTMNPSTAQYEIGSKINSLSFAWVLNKDVTSQTLTGCTISATDRSANYSSAITTNKTFTLTVDDGKNTATASKSISFLPNIYFGASAEGAYNNAFILSLPSKQLKGSKAGSYSMNIGSNTYGYLAIPKSYGQITTVNIGGFDTELDDLGVVSVTNESNYTQDYRLYKTTNKNLGSISMTVK